MSLELKLREFLQNYLPRFKEARRSFISDCPSCHKEAHFWIRKTNGASICFKCGKKYSWRTFVALTAKVDLIHAYRLLFGTGGGDHFETPLALEFETQTIQAEINRPITLGPDFTPLASSERGMSYVLSRTPFAPLEHYNLRYHATMDAVVFPVRLDGVTYGWQARRIEPKANEPRLISAAHFNKSQFLLNYDRARVASKLILVEGPFDCLSVDVFPEYGAVASLGKQLSFTQQKLLLDSAAQDIYLGLDPDAFDEIYELVNILGLSKRFHRILPPDDKKDFGECEPRAVYDALTQAQRMEHSVNFLGVHLK